MLRRIKNFIHLLNAFIAATYYGWPAKKMTVIGVTGTSGKTTVTHLIFEILKKAGSKVSMVSTVSAVVNNKNYDTGFHVTTPSPWAIQKFIKMAYQYGSKYFVLEVTSHALDQNRVFGIPIEIGVVTNVSHEHLDYHKTLNNYRATKAKILKEAKYCVLNKDEANYDFLKAHSGGIIVTYAIDKPADYTKNSIQFTPSLLGEYNLYNCLAAAAVASKLNVDKKVIQKTVAEFSGIPGRLEEMKNNKGFKIYIDFAHKPDALEQVLKTVRKLTEKKLIVIFGCAGLRDRLKRPIMGEIAARLADYIVLTAEDPRTEDVRDIIQSIAGGCLNARINEADKKDKDLAFLKNNKKFFWRIPDRQEAINFVIRNLLKRGDLLIICGKGHERSMCYGKVEYPFDEKKAVKKALYGAIKTAS